MCQTAVAAAVGILSASPLGSSFLFFLLFSSNSFSHCFSLTTTVKKFVCVCQLLSLCVSLCAAAFAAAAVGDLCASTAVASDHS